MAPEVLSGAGKIFGKDISWETYYANQQWVRLWYPDEFNQLDSAITQPIVEQETWDRLILLEEAKRQGIKISEKELAAFIRTMPLFLEEGQFVSTRYYRLLEMLNMSPSQFEGLLKTTLMVEELVEQQRAMDITVSEEDIAQTYQDTYQKARVRIALFSNSSYTEAAQANVTEEDLRSYFEAHAEQYTAAPVFTIEYAGISTSAMEETIEVSDDEIQEAWNVEQNALIGDESTPPEMTDEDRQRIRGQLVKQAVVEARDILATDLNVDIQNELAWDDMVSNYTLAETQVIGPISLEEAWQEGEPAISILQTMQMFEPSFTDVFESTHGVYLARLLSKAPGRPQTFEEAKDTVLRQVVQEKASALAQNEALETQTLAAELIADKPLEEVIAELNINPLVPGPIHRTAIIPGLGSIPALNNAALSLEAGSVSEVMPIPQGHAFIFVEERLEADMSDLEKYREDILKTTQEAKQKELFVEWLSDVRGRANLTSNLEELKALNEAASNAS